MVNRLIAAASILLCLAVSPACSPAWASENEPAPPISNRPAPFDSDLQRLAEILGALHYLRAICGAHDGQQWRDQMQDLIDAEAPVGERRRKIIASFNRGYDGFRRTYRTCTPAANLVIRRYLTEGAKIAHDITAHYAN